MIPDNFLLESATLDSLDRLRHITALRLMGLSNEDMQDLTGDSEATIKRYNERFSQLIATRKDCENAEGLKRTLEAARNAVQGTVFKELEDEGDTERELMRVLSTDSHRYVSLLWFGNVHKGRRKPMEMDEEYIGWFVSPDSTAFGFQRDSEQANRTQNLEFALTLMGVGEEGIQQICASIGLPSPRPDVVRQTWISTELESSHRLLGLAPRYPRQTKQKERKLLVNFALQHLRRDIDNFVYAEVFDRKQIAPESVDETKPLTSWWVHGPKDILDWFECHSF